MYLANDRTRQRHPLNRRFSHLLMLEGGAFGTDCRASKIGNPGRVPRRRRLYTNDILSQDT